MLAIGFILGVFAFLGGVLWSSYDRGPDDLG